MDAPWIEIVGCGPGGVDYVTPAARAAVARAGLVLGWPRCLDLFPEASARAEKAGGVEAVLERLRRARAEGRRAAVLVSGDVGLFSLARKVVDEFGLEACRLTPGVSALQAACARFGLPWHNGNDYVHIVDAHARVPNREEIENLFFMPAVVFMDRGEGRAWTAEAARRLVEMHTVWLCERLTCPDERVFEADADDVAKAEPPSVAVFIPRDGVRTDPLGAIHRFHAAERAAAVPRNGLGTLYGIGIGPGDPQAMTMRATDVLARCDYLFAPRSPKSDGSLALRIVEILMPLDVITEELEFPMTRDPAALAEHWDRAAARVDEVLMQGHDAAFPTLGDVSLYSTFTYLARALRKRRPDARIRAVAGVTSVSAAAAATGFPLGEGKEPLIVLPAGDDPAALGRALDYLAADASGGVVAVMKIGARLPALLDELSRRGLLEHAALAKRVGLDDEEIWTDLSALSAEDRERAGYLSVLLVRAGGGL